MTGRLADVSNIFVAWSNEQDREYEGDILYKLLPTDVPESNISINTVLNDNVTDFTDIENIAYSVINLNKDIDISSIIAEEGTFDITSIIKSDISDLSVNNLDVSSDANFKSDIFISGNIDIGGHQDISGNIKSYGNLDISGYMKSGGNLDISGYMKAGGNLDISGYMKAGGNLDISGYMKAGGNLDISGYMKAGGNLDVSGDVKTDGHLDVSGYMKAGGNLDVSGDVKTDGHLEVSGYTKIGEYLDVSGDVKTDGHLDVSGYMKSGGNLDVSGDVKAGGYLDISGNIKTYGNLDVSGVVDISGDIKTRGNLDVSGNIKTYGNLDVSGNIDISGDAKTRGNLDVSGNIKTYGNLDVSGNIDISGDMKMRKLEASSTSNLKDISASGILDLSGVLKINGFEVGTGDNGLMFNQIDSSVLNATGNIYTGGNIKAQGNITAFGSIDVSGNLDISGDTTARRNLDVSGNVNIEEKLDIFGDTKAHGNLDVSGNVNIEKLSVAGESYLKYTNVTDLSAQGNVDIAGYLFVNGVKIVNLGTYTDKIIIKGDFDICGETTLYKSLEVSGNIHASSNLDVSGDVKIVNNLEVLGVTKVKNLYNNNVDMYENYSIYDVSICYLTTDTSSENYLWTKDNLNNDYNILENANFSVNQYITNVPDIKYSFLEPIRSFATNDAGNIIIIGQPTINNNRGMVVIKELSGNSWLDKTIITGKTVNEQLGHSVSMNGDGHKYVIASYNNGLCIYDNDVSSSFPEHDNPRIVKINKQGDIVVSCDNNSKIRKYTYTNNVWGSDMTIDTSLNGGIMDYNDDIMIINDKKLFYSDTSYNKVHIHDLSENNSIQIIEGVASSNFGSSLSTDENASRLIIGAYGKTATTLSGEVLIYDYSTVQGEYVENSDISDATISEIGKRGACVNSYGNVLSVTDDSGKSANIYKNVLNKWEYIQTLDTLTDEIKKDENIVCLDDDTNIDFLKINSENEINTYAFSKPGAKPLLNRIYPNIIIISTQIPDVITPNMTKTDLSSSYLYNRSTTVLNGYDLSYTNVEVISDRLYTKHTCSKIRPKYFLIAKNLKTIIESKTKTTIPQYTLYEPGSYNIYNYKIKYQDRRLQKYGLYEGTYTFNNIPDHNPIAIINTTDVGYNLLSYTGVGDVSINKTVWFNSKNFYQTPQLANGDNVDTSLNVTFYSGTITVNVIENGDFKTSSLLCISGNEQNNEILDLSGNGILVYTETCNPDFKITNMYYEDNYTYNIPPRYIFNKEGDVLYALSKYGSAILVRRYETNNKVVHKNVGLKLYDFSNNPILLSDIQTILIKNDISDNVITLHTEHDFDISYTFIVNDVSKPIKRIDFENIGSYKKEFIDHDNSLNDYIPKSYLSDVYHMVMIEPGAKSVLNVAKGKIGVSHFAENVTVDSNLLVKGDINCLGTVSQSSDERLKYNRENILGIETLRQLNPQKYVKTNEPLKENETYTDKNYTIQAGFIAQEVLETDLNFLVKVPATTDNFIPYALDYNSIFVYSIQAIKELDADLSYERTKVLNLENDLSNERAKVSQLENNIDNLITDISLIKSSLNIL